MHFENLLKGLGDITSITEKMQNDAMKMKASAMEKVTATGNNDAMKMADDLMKMASDGKVPSMEVIGKMMSKARELDERIGKQQENANTDSSK